MSTYEPGRLYLIDVDGETHQARYHLGIHQFLYLNSGQTIPNESVANVRPAIVLDPWDKNVKHYVKYWGGAPPEGSGVGSLSLVARAIAAQITPPEPPMEEPTELLERVTDDAGNWVRWSISTRTFEPWAWCDSLGIDTRQRRRWSDMRNPRSYENPREKPATGAESDAQGSAGGIGRVSDSEAGERAQAHAEAWVEWGKRARGEDSL